MENKLFIGKTIFLAGDSRSSTDYSFYKEILHNKTGAEILVQGGSGWKTAAIASNNYFDRLINNPHDYSIWLVGGNDKGLPNEVGTFKEDTSNHKMGEPIVKETNIDEDYNGTYFIQAVDHIMRKYKKLFYDWKRLDNGHKPVMIFCTDLPQKRAADLDWENPINWERKNNAIKECCIKNNVECLDLFQKCHFDMDFEPSWRSPTDMIHNNGLYFMDGLHPNAYGIDIITSLEVERLKKYIKTI